MRVTVRDLPIALLIVALLLLDNAAYVGVVGQPRHVSYENGSLIYALALSQACLLGMWAGLGLTRSAIRIPVVVAALGGLIQFVCFLAPEHPIPWYYQTSVLLHVGLTCLFVACVWFARMSSSMQLVRDGDPTDAARQPFIAVPFQFTIFEMMQLVAGFGASLAILKTLYPSYEQMPGDALTIHFEYVAMFVIPGLIALWAVLNTKFRMWRLGVLVAATWALSIVYSTSYDDTQNPPEKPLRVWVYLALVTAALFVCHVCGYRIEKRRADRVALASAVGQCERASTLD